MRTTITIPTSLDEAGSALEGLDRLLTAKSWERAALVYAFTRNNGPGQPEKNGRKTTHSLTQREFARLGFKGLTDHHTVIAYRQSWQWAIDLTPA